MSSCMFLSTSVTDKSEYEELGCRYSIPVLIINKGVYHYNGDVEIQLEGLSLGLDQKPFPILLYYRFDADSAERAGISKYFQIGNFYQITGNGMKAEKESTVTIYYPEYEKIKFNNIPQRLASILVDSISPHDLCFEYDHGSELMNKQYTKQQIFPSLLCLHK